MSIESDNFMPPSEYYERPYVPSPDEAKGYLFIPLLPVEAHSILVDRAGTVMSELDALALQRISDSEEEDIALDYKKIRRKIAEELGVEDDWE